MKADFQPGFLHRGAEKLFEARDFRSAVMLADRHDWQASFIGELCISQTCEIAMGLRPAARTERLRVLLSELARAHSHAAYLSYLPHRYDDPAAGDALRQFRESIRLLWGDLSGNRVHPMLTRLGGLAAEPSEEWLANSNVVATGAGALADRLGELAWTQVPPGIAPIDQRLVGGYGLSGPVSAASGLLIDERIAQLSKSAPGLSLPRLPANTEGDARARFISLAQDLALSGTIIQECLADLPEGQTAVKLSKIIKVPEGVTYSSIAAPWGTAGSFLVSRGDRVLWRLGLRTPTFANCSVLAEALVGADVDHLDTAIASLGYGIGDLDR